MSDLVSNTSMCSGAARRPPKQILKENLPFLTRTKKIDVFKNISSASSAAFSLPIVGDTQPQRRSMIIKAICKTELLIIVTMLFSDVFWTSHVIDVRGARGTPMTTQPMLL